MIILPERGSFRMDASVPPTALKSFCRSRTDAPAARATAPTETSGTVACSRMNSSARAAMRPASFGSPVDWRSTMPRTPKVRRAARRARPESSPTSASAAR